jgi:predicted Mrr-cat superfamily restriction endonuclease
MLLHRIKILTIVIPQSKIASGVLDFNASLNCVCMQHLKLEHSQQVILDQMSRTQIPKRTIYI